MSLAARGVWLDIGGSVHEPTEPNRAAAVRRIVKELSSSRPTALALAPGRHHCGQGQGRPRDQQPKLSPARSSTSGSCENDANHTTAELADLLNVSRPTMCRAIRRGGTEAAPARKRSQSDQAVMGIGPSWSGTRASILVSSRSHLAGRR